MKTYTVIFIVLLAFVLFPQVTEAQCAMCKAAVQSSMDQPNSVAKGLNKGILYLMAVPYVLMAFIFRKQIVSLWRSLRRKKVAEVISTEE